MLEAGSVADAEDAAAWRDVVAKQALQELVCRYSRAVDRRDFDSLAGLYLHDAIHDHGDMFRGEPAALITWLKQSPATMLTQHFVGNCLFHVEGDRAEGEIYTINYHVLPVDPESGERRDYVAGGRYLDRYRRVGGRWYFEQRQRVIDWRHQRPSNPGATGAEVHQGSPGRDDPSWNLQWIIK